jgi:predicted nucleotidyltransferase
MSPNQNPNASLLLSAVEKLVPLLDRIVFVGGCASGLLLTDPGAAPVRPTIDVDAIVQIASYDELMILERRLRQLGFEQPHLDGAPLCRWIHGDVILDLMPTDSTILGFSNRWYPQALEDAETVEVGGYQIQLISAPYFLATKLEAFHGRGQFDYRMSRDMEDIVTVLDGRPEIVAEVERCAALLQQYLKKEFARLLLERDFVEALPGHLLPDQVSQQRIRIVLERIRQIVGRG